MSADKITSQDARNAILAPKMAYLGALLVGLVSEFRALNALVMCSGISTDDEDRLRERMRRYEERVEEAHAAASLFSDYCNANEDIREDLENDTEAFRSKVNDWEARSQRSARGGLFSWLGSPVEPPPEAPYFGDIPKAQDIGSTKAPMDARTGGRADDSDLCNNEGCTDCAREFQRRKDIRASVPSPLLDARWPSIYQGRTAHTATLTLLEPEEEKEEEEDNDAW